MANETLQELRERLLRQQSVQQMIQVRAYELFQMRGSHPGSEAQDWFRAEGEVLAFLLADESAREEQPEPAPAPSAAAIKVEGEPAVASKPKSGARRKSSEAKAKAPKKQAAKPPILRKAAPSRPKTPRTSSKSKTEE